jgi:hypothetical protein
VAVVESIAGRGRGGGIENMREERRSAPPGETLRVAIVVCDVDFVLNNFYTLPCSTADVANSVPHREPEHFQSGKSLHKQFVRR